MILKHQEHLFDIPKEITYLNIASQSPAFKTVYQAGLEGLAQKSKPYTIHASDYFEPVKEVKQLFAKLIDAEDYNRIVTIPSVSYGIATIANNIKLKEGDEILIIDEQFPSNYYSWKKLADTNKAILKTVICPKEQENPTQQWNNDILNEINDNTALVAMGNIHWSNGRLFHLEAIRKKTKHHKTLLIIDGSQSIGALPFSVKEIQPDALVVAGYKWLFGPYGCAYAYYGDYFDNGVAIEENWANRLNSEYFSGLTNYESKYKSLANRYAAGQSGSFIYIKMQIAALKEVLKISPKDLQNYCNAISKDALYDLNKLGFYSDDPQQRAKHLFGIKVPKNIDLEILKNKLKMANIYVSVRGNYLRISCHIYNNNYHFEKLVKTIKKLTR